MWENFYHLLDEGFPTRNLMLGRDIPPVKSVRDIYASVEEYQAIHSNLLLEDFLHPLRCALEEIRENPHLRSLENAWVYRRVKLKSLKKKEGDVITCKLRVRGNAYRRQPTFGHLLIFSQGEFNRDLFLGMIGSADFDDEGDVIKGVDTGEDGDIGLPVCDYEDEIFPVCDHQLNEESDGDGGDTSSDDNDSPIDVKKGADIVTGTTKKKKQKSERVKLKFLRGHKPNLQQLAGGQYVMIETKAFFFMYFHVLRVLNSFDQNTFPLQEIILNCRNYIQSNNNRNSDGNTISRSIFTRSFFAHMPQNFREWLRLEKEELNLNKSQFEALRDTFNNKLTLIQGPPGTGKTVFGAGLVKTYLDLCLVSDKYPEVGTVPKPPFLIVCQTNHALDNILKKVLEFTNKIVRVGGQCKSMRVTPYCLAELVCHKVVLAYPDCENHAERLRASGRRHMYSCRIRLSQHLRELHTRRRELLELTRLMRSSDDQTQVLEYLHVLTDYKRRVRGLERDVPKFYEKLPGRRALMLEVFSKADVIGMTTTGAAIRSDILNELKLPLVVVEEAAAVLESHVVVSVTNHCKCLVMLGDHKQLRPCLTNFLLEECNFNISLFERLINNGHVVRCLNPQYRMRPEISALLREAPYFYDDLVDGPGTEGRPPVKGMVKNVFFLDYDNDANLKKELAGLAPGSFWNKYEVKMLLKLADYLVTMGNSPSDIAIIAMYGEQKRMLKEEREKYPNIRSLEIATVDGFQGKEKEIILLSLVRSNPDGNIGFVRIPNRVCVALSRAKSGLFIIGDMNCLTMRGQNKPTVWETSIDRLKRSGSLGVKLHVKCRNHPPFHEHFVSGTADWYYRFCEECPALSKTSSDSESEDSVSSELSWTDYLAERNLSHFEETDP